MKRPRFRACVAAGIDCGGRGYHEIRFVHVRGEGLTAGADFFRAPCICSCATTWINNHGVDDAGKEQHT